MDNDKSSPAPLTVLYLPQATIALIPTIISTRGENSMLKKAAHPHIIQA